MLLQELSDAIGVSGAEGEVRRLLADHLRPHVDELRSDTLGNLIAIKGADGAAHSGDPRLRVMLAAHMDEVGVMITGIEKSGLLKFKAVGGLDPRLLPATRLSIGPAKLPGVIVTKPAHLLKPEEANKIVEPEQMSIDIGAGSREDAAAKVRVGDCGTFATRFEYLGDVGGSQRLVKGKAFDDRAGCALLADLLTQRYAVDILAVFTVQEEVGLRGARVAAFALEPDVAIVFEGTISDDLPKEREASPVTRLGHGPAFTIADRSFVADRRLLELLIETAERESIPFQFKEPALGGTDAGAIHLSKTGIPCAAVSVPCRYIHGPASVLHRDDFDHAVSLMRSVLNRLGEWDSRAGVGR